MIPDLLTVLACVATLVWFVLTLVVAAWQPGHRCMFKDACPHWRKDQAEIAKRAAARKARNDQFHS